MISYREDGAWWKDKRQWTKVRAIRYNFKKLL